MATGTDFTDLIRNLREQHVTYKLPSSGNCLTCERPSRLSCSRCHRRFFCDRNCQAEMHELHKRECYPLQKSLLQDASNQMLLEAFNLTLFAEYKALEWRMNLGGNSVFDKVDHTIYEGFIDMILIDPKRGDTPDDPEMVKRFEAAQEKIKAGGRLLVDSGNNHLMRFYQENPFIPKGILRDLNFLWDGIGDWKA